MTTRVDSARENFTDIHDTKRYDNTTGDDTRISENVVDLTSDNALGSALLLEFAPPLSVSQIQQLSPTALAYLGDAVYELYIRRYYLVPPQRPQAYHHQVVAQVRAEAQAHHLQALLPHLSPAELDIVKRGRNAAGKRPHRTDPEIYQRATSLEALVGYLYLADAQRLQTLLECLRVELMSTTPSA